MKQQPQQLNISLSKKEIMDNAKDIVCKSCDKNVFEKVFLFKKISKLLTGTPEDIIIPLETFRCVYCRIIPEEFQIDNK